MVNFSNDVDILRYEPILFGELYLPSQVPAKGEDGVLNGTSFTADDADFVNASVAAGGVIYLKSEDGILDGAYEIVSVDSTTELTVSIIRSSGDDISIAPPSATNISYRISTFRPQAGETGFQLTEYFGIKPGNPASDIEVEDILDTNALRLASVFAVISGVYAMLASRAENENFWKKSLYYQRLFEKARERCRVCIDTDGDGAADIERSGASIRLRRD